MNRKKSPRIKFFVNNDALILETDVERLNFWRKVALSKDGCWHWTGAKTGAGYGAFRIRGKIVLAHRISFVMAKGEIPMGKVLDHVCCCRHCINPEHLEAVYHMENVLRGAARGNKWKVSSDDIDEQEYKEYAQAVLGNIK